MEIYANHVKKEVTNNRGAGFYAAALLCGRLVVPHFAQNDIYPLFFFYKYIHI